MCEIFVLSKTELDEAVRRAVRIAVIDLRQESSAAFPEIMTLEQVCAYTHFTRQTILKFIKDGLPISRRCASPRFFKAEVEQWLKSKYRSCL